MDFLIVLGSLVCIASILAMAIYLSIKRSLDRIIPGSEWIRDDATNNPFITVPFVTVVEVSENHLTYRDDDNLYTAEKFRFTDRYKLRPSKDKGEN